jgi:predicted DNA-binding transcriptional regulator AlpA
MHRGKSPPRRPGPYREEAVDSPRQRTELDDLTRRLVEMPLADQYEFAARVEQLVNLERPLLRDEAAERRETLECLRQAMAQLGVERPLTKDEYEGVQKTLGLAWSWQRIHRLWGSFSLAARVATGVRLPQTWQERDFRRRFVRTNGDWCEEGLSAVRLWLATEPQTRTRKSYSEFVRQHNRMLKDGELPLPQAVSLCNRLALKFREVVAAASGETPVEEVVARAREGKDWSRGPDDLVSSGTIALMAGVSVHAASRLIRDAYFPRPVLILARTDVWLREEVQAFLDGERSPLGEADRLREHYLTTQQVAERVAIGPRAISTRGLGSLKPVAQVGKVHLWLPDEVEEYARANAAAIARRQRNRAQPGRREGRKTSRFVTLSGFANEVGLDNAQAQRIFNEPGFPPSVAWFGNAGLWLREEVERYLLGEPVEPRPTNSLQELLMTGPEVQKELAYSASTYRHADLPPPAALTNVGNVYERSDIEAHLDADPKRRELLEARRARRARVAQRA